MPKQYDLSLRGSGLSGRVLGVAVKQLSAVDLPRGISNQHELGGSRPLVAILGAEKIRRGRIRWFVLRDDDRDFAAVESRFTWYDSRERKPRAAEFRFYYSNPHGLETAAEGDLIFLLAVQEQAGVTVAAYLVAQGSTWEAQLRWLFGLEAAADLWATRDAVELASKARSISALDLLETLDLEESAESTPGADLEIVRRRFGNVFPPTRDFSDFAREVIALPSSTTVDDLLIGWIEREEQLFRALEEYIVRDKLAAGFTDVDDFVAFSLSVHNRRKSRMGYALENHFRAILEAREIPHSYNQPTENRARPDFLFPGIVQYRNPGFPAERLRMLGAKSTCKDRWRQVLSEAARISPKHLLTLEPGISESQTNEMRSANLQLVIPEPLHYTYSNNQRAWLQTIEHFLQLVGS